MKKVVSIAPILMTAAVISAPITAFAASDTGNNTFTLTDGIAQYSPSNQTEVKYEVNPAYTVTIPATIELVGENGKNPTKTAKIEADSVFLNPKDYISITVSSAHAEEGKFYMVNSIDNSVKLPYTATGLSTEEIAHFTTSTTPKTQDIVFTATEAATNAGTYSDNVTFKIEVKTEAEPEPTP